ncbi:MAG: RIO1 family regulatory kinase/ATPase [Candidatus Bathyarchaeia archaeon]
MKKAFIVPIEGLTQDTAYAQILCYPKPEKVELKKRLKELQTLGVTALEFRGLKQVSNVNVLGKGCVGIVLIAHVNKKKAALKVRRLDADRSMMRHEAEMLEKANSVTVGPELLGYTGNMVLMQFVDGFLLPEWLRERVEKVRIRKVLREVLEQCWLLDNIGLDHGELSHAPKHIIVDRADRPFIVDFETASVNRAPANVTSICQFLFISDIAGEVAGKIGEKDKMAIIEALRSYKKCRNRESFEMVLEACGL